MQLAAIGRKGAIDFVEDAQRHADSGKNNVGSSCALLSTECSHQLQPNFTRQCGLVHAHVLRGCSVGIQRVEYCRDALHLVVLEGITGRQYRSRSRALTADLNTHQSSSRATQEAELIGDGQVVIVP